MRLQNKNEIIYNKQNKMYKNSCGTQHVEDTVLEARRV